MDTVGVGGSAGVAGEVPFKQQDGSAFAAGHMTQI